MNDTTTKLVRVLPNALSDMVNTALTGPSLGWRRNDDFRIICNCQEHARRERTLLRRSLRAARIAAGYARKRSVAFLIGVPVAFGIMGLPMEAMDSSLPKLAERTAFAMTSTATSTADVISHNHFSIFTTPKARHAFLAPTQEVATFTFELAKEQFFRTQVPYGAIIYREARRNNLSPEFVAAVVEAESDFRPRLVSSHNAKGLMQIVPETGRLMGSENLFNPEENVAAGTKYLRYLFDRFGDEKMVLAAYNAGEGNVEKFGGIPPFSETQNYLLRVTARTHQYDRRIRVSYVASARLHNAVAE